MKNKFYTLTRRLQSLFARPAYAEQDPRAYLQKEDIIELSRTEAQFIDLETNRLLLRRRASERRRIRLGLPEGPVPGNNVYAVYVQTNF